MKLEAPKTLTIDGIEHEVAALGEKVVNLVNIHTIWRSELSDQRLAVAKSEAAMRSLESELLEAVRAALAPKEPVVESTPDAE